MLSVVKSQYANLVEKIPAGQYYRLVICRKVLTYFSFFLKQQSGLEFLTICQWQLGGEMHSENL